MATMKMIITIGFDGKPTIEVEGAAGDACLEFTRQVEQALGEVEDRRRNDAEGVSEHASILVGS